MYYFCLRQRRVPVASWTATTSRASAAPSMVGRVRLHDVKFDWVGLGVEIVSAGKFVHWLWQSSANIWKQIWHGMVFDEYDIQMAYHAQLLDLGRAREIRRLHAITAIRIGTRPFASSRKSATIGW